VRANNVFEALADHTRRAVLELLRVTAVMTAGDLAAAFPDNSREWLYSLDSQLLAEITQTWFAQFAPLWEESLRNLNQPVE
jgi:hypothetical protein